MESLAHMYMLTFILNSISFSSVGLRLLQTVQIYKIMYRKLLFIFYSLLDIFMVGCMQMVKCFCALFRITSLVQKCKIYNYKVINMIL